MGSFNTYAKNAMTAYIATLQANIHNGTFNAEVAMRANLTCLTLGKNVYGMQDALCSQFLGGLDALWLAYAFIAIGAMISMPGFIFAANRLLSNNLSVGSEIPLDYAAVKQSKPTGGPKTLKTHPDDDDHGGGNGRTIKIMIN